MKYAARCCPSGFASKIDVVMMLDFVVNILYLVFFIHVKSFPFLEDAKVARLSISDSD
jgi:phosphoglycerol transferase MdoB-like AlkP superfamily enzyme